MSCLGGLEGYPRETITGASSLQLHPVLPQTEHDTTVSTSQITNTRRNPMAPPTSLRAAFAYAGNLVSQIPLLSNLSPSLPSSLQPIPHDSQQQAAEHVGGDFGFDASSITPYDPLSDAPSCPIDGPTSCQNKTAGDSCCFVYPGGRLLLTQFWDEEIHVGGSEQDWTAHGLWPDLCDGSYDQYCGMAPRFNNITEVLKHYDQGEFGTNDHLWAHEYNKHATCINTLAPSCYGDAYTPGMEVVDYFVRAFGLFRMLDTYYALSDAGLEPSHGDTVELAKVQSTLERFSGGRVILKCTGRHHDVLHEAWYVYFVKGSLQSGEFVPAQDSFKGDQGNCADRVRYLPKRK
ncbi:Uu.00g132730.m01.CDS01 [Anthostomella pinea]|uniref:ribonuclease T2 n=1 Tax=Anthostomella pinea TaxID=933095 RepID=A0AAI8VSX9_9PEZI|nr:Uu.00g132730.m01.CDS01 [Anthostomella pinea]